MGQDKGRLNGGLHSGALATGDRRSQLARLGHGAGLPGNGCLAFLTSRATFPQATAQQERAFWVLVLLLLTGLVINKQFELQSALTAAGCCLAHAQAWYG